MKTLLLTAASFILISFNSMADDKTKTTKTETVITTPAPMVIGNPDAEPPTELKDLLANPSTVNVAPFIMGNPEDAEPEELKFISAYSEIVPVAPMVIGNPDEQAPDELAVISAWPN